MVSQSENAKRRVSLLSYVLTAFVSILGCSSSGHHSNDSNIITDGDFRSVYLIGHGDQTATAFMVVRGGRQCLVTAKHFAKGMDRSDTIQVFKDNHWVGCACRLIGNGEGEIDISVFELLKPFTRTAFSTTPIARENDSIAAGCEVWILGFPLQIVEYQHGEQYPMPFLKHAYISGLGSTGHWFLDVHINRGLSGSPIFGRTATGATRLLGVVSGFVPESVEHSSSESLETNSGIALAIPGYYIDRIIEASSREK